MQNISIPISIVIAGAIVAGAILFTSDGTRASGTTNPSETAAGHNSFGNSNSNAAANVRPVDLEIDHIFGNPNAKVKIVEYSDFECPFCSRLHPTLESVVEDFGGEVAWVYRHFPLTSIHPRATGAAIASECVAELAGNDAFWQFGTEVFKNQRGLNEALYIREAQNLGIEAADFEACLGSGKYEIKVANDAQNAVQSGGRGTPFTVVINENGDVFPFSGALPYENVRSIVEAALEG